MGITTEVFVSLGWLDRIRVQLGGVIEVEVTINTEHEPGKTTSMGFTRVRPPKKFEGKGEDYGEG